MSISGTEIIDPDIPRVDAVDGPAHGMPFILLKSADPVSAETVRKADDMADVPDAEALDLTETPNVSGTTVNPDKAGDADIPSSPTWEAVDAAGARSAVSQLASLRALVEGLSDREQAEGDDMDNEWDLQDACGAIDFALGVLAKFAVTEQSEADQAAEAAKDEARAMGLIKALRTPVVKAGRVLSGPNEAALQQAYEQIGTVLDQVKVAPMAAEGGEPVAKAQDPATPMPIALMSLATQFAAALTAWQEDGTAPATPDPTLAAPDPNAPADPTADPAVTPPATPPATPDPGAPVTTPAPTPAPTAPTADPNDPNKVVAKALDSAEVQTDLEKSLADRIEALVAERTAAIEKRLHAMESTPVNDGPMLSGARPVQRGGETATTDGSFESVRKQLAAETDPAKRLDGIQALISGGLLPHAAL